MKNFKHILLASLFLLPAATRGQVTVVNNGFAAADGKAAIDVMVIAEGLDLGSDGQLRVEMRIEGNGQTLVLPEVVYTARQRYRFEQRKAVLSGLYEMPPYYVYKGVRKKDRYELNYLLSVPWQPWMAGASLRYELLMLGCSGELPEASGTLVHSMTAPGQEACKPSDGEVWMPEPTVYRQMVCFIVPEVEEVKSRNTAVEMHLNYPVNIHEVRPAFGDNTAELIKADHLMKLVLDNELITLKNISITGYASPEGTYPSNNILARRRAEGFRDYLVRNYGERLMKASVLWHPEDWDGLGRLVEASGIERKDEALVVINDRSSDPDTRETILKEVVGWPVYNEMLGNMYPRLRRIELRADYVVSDLSDDRAAELIYTHPSLLSLEEMYRVALRYEPGSPEYMEIYRIAAREYPGDMIANNNAAAAHLMNGDAESARLYLEKVGESGPVNINLGAYFYIKGNFDKAEDFFKRACADDPQAERNLRLMNIR